MYRLVCALMSVAVVLMGQAANGKDVKVDSAATVKYLLSCQKANGAFGPIDQEYSDLAWNYPAVHALTLLNVDIPRAADCLDNGQWAAFRQPDAHRTNLHWDLYQKTHLNLLLAAKIKGRDIDVFPGQRKSLGLLTEDDRRIKPGRNWELQYKDRQAQYYGPYGVGVFYDIPTLWYMTDVLTSLDGTITNPELATEYILARQAAGSGFVNAYTAEGPVAPEDAHLAVTYHAVMTLKALGKEIPNRESCIAWIRSCQEPSGGFRWSPTRDDYSNKPDVWYTWAAVRALDALGARPADTEGCLKWLNSLQNSDGGFADRPGWNSRLYSTYYAVHALDILTGDARKGIRAKTVSDTETAIPEGKYEIFQAHLKAPAVSNESPTEMVEEVRAIRLNLVGAKTADVSEARDYVEKNGYALEVLACPENYPHKMLWIGGFPANHISNWLIPPSMSKEQQTAFSLADEAGKQELPWRQFKACVISPALEIGTVFYPELDYSMVNAYMAYDDGLDGRPGFTGFLAALGWPAWDWVRHFPYRERWVGKLPALADGDAHGDIAKWKDRLLKQRVLYFAERYDFPHFLEALKNGRSVCVIRDADTSSGVVYYGGPAAVKYAKKHRSQWQWW
ncbi:MAG: prenyltransferase/squalene oxidase repeat-containing protein [Planctomycetota bacterium]